VVEFSVRAPPAFDLADFIAENCGHVCKTTQGSSGSSAPRIKFAKG
jgi:hypothetical protein